MFLQIGGDTIIRSKDIVGVFDIDKTTVFKVNRNYLSNVQKKSKIVDVTQKLPKSFVVCQNSNTETVYISPLLPSTVLKRSDGISESGLYGGEEDKKL